MYEKSKKRKIALSINESNNKKKNLQFYINTETQQWTRRTRRKNSFDLINFPFANFKIIRTNEPFNSIIKHNQSNNARKHGRSKCRHISTSKKKKPLPPPLSKNEGAPRNEGTCVRAIKGRHWFPLEIPLDDGKIHKLRYACPLEIVSIENEGTSVYLSFFLNKRYHSKYSKS